MSATGTITWDGKNSANYALTVAKYPDYRKPARKIDVYSVPGRNGDIIQVQDAWDNVTQEYDIWAGTGQEDSVPVDFTTIARWLYGSSGYKTLADDFDPDHFRVAYFAGPFDIENIMSSTGRATIKFTCKPQRYRNDGQTAVRIFQSGSTITNPTGFNARPLLVVEGEGAEGTVTVNGTTFTISDTTENIYIDCEEMNCRNSSGSNRNSLVSSSTSEFATLAPGENSISFSGGVSVVQVTPRWWEL